MSLDLDIWLGEERLPVEFNGSDTRYILKGIAGSSGQATERFIDNLRQWAKTFSHARCGDIADKLKRVYRLAEINRSYIRWTIG